MARIFAVLLSVVVVGLAVWLAVTLYTETPAADLWAVEPLEQVVEPPKPGESVTATFRLTNRSGRPLRILGEATC